MVAAVHKSRRSVNSEGRCTVLVSGLVLALFASGCSGGEPRDHRAEQRSDGKPSTETSARAAQTEESTTTQPAEPRERQRKPRALVWVGLEDADQVALVDIARGKVIARREAPGGPHNVTVASDGTAAATLYGSDRVVLVRPGGRTSFIELGGRPHDVKAARSLFVVANEAGRRLDFIRSGKHVASLSLEAEPHDLAIAPDGNRVWVTLNGTDKLAIVNLHARQVVRFVATGFRPHDILFAPNGRLWVTDWQGPVHVFDRRGRVQGSVELGQESHHLAFTPNGRQAWITDHAAGRVFVVDARSLEVIAALPVPGGPHHVAITPDGTRAAVADHESGMVVVYNVKRRSRVGVIAVGAGPHGVWAVPTAPSR
jgi:DNA-binding beta-propeller fold protein YncE